MGQLEDMQVFVRIVDAGGISPAADQLGVAKSAVSRRLSELENRLGVSLLNRTTRSSNLTDAGKTFYERSQQLINDVNELNSLTSDPEFSLSGTLRISVPLSFGLSHLAKPIEIFSKEHPELSMDITFIDSETDLVEGGYDLAFRIGELEDSSLKARKITPIKLVVCASPEYLKQHGTPQTPEDLKDHQMLKYAFYDKLGWKLMDKNGKPHMVQVQSKITANNGDFLNQMAIANFGILLTPTFISWEALEKKQLVQILTDYKHKEIYSYIVYPQTRHLSRKIRLFIDFLKDYYGDEPYWDKKLSDN